MMDPIVSPLLELLGSMEISPPKIPFVSNVTGEWVTLQDLIDPNYWAHHLTKTVRFSDGVKELLMKDINIFIEIGPGQMLCSYVSKYTESAAIISILKHDYDYKTDEEYLIRCLTKLWLEEIDIKWDDIFDYRTKDIIKSLISIMQ